MGICQIPGTDMYRAVSCHGIPVLSVSVVQALYKTERKGKIHHSALYLDGNRYLSSGAVCSDLAFDKRGCGISQFIYTTVAQYPFSQASFLDDFAAFRGCMGVLCIAGLLCRRQDSGQSGGKETVGTGDWYQFPFGDYRFIPVFFRDSDFVFISGRVPAAGRIQLFFLCAGRLFPVADCLPDKSVHSPAVHFMVQGAQGFKMGADCIFLLYLYYDRIFCHADASVCGHAPSYLPAGSGIVGADIADRAADRLYRYYI